MVPISLVSAFPSKRNEFLLFWAKIRGKWKIRSGCHIHSIFYIRNKKIDLNFRVSYENPNLNLKCFSKSSLFKDTSSKKSQVTFGILPLTGIGLLVIE